MMGDKDFNSIVKNAIDLIGKELETDRNLKDTQTINLSEVVQCLRRSYYDRVEPKEFAGKGFNDLFSGMLRKLEFGSKSKEFAIDNIKLKGQADMIVDNCILLFRSATNELEVPYPSDVLYLNSCMWIYDKLDGVIVYIVGDGKEITFSLTRHKTMFEEVIRRVRVLNDLLKERKIPILEPSVQCFDCQYYERCFAKKSNTKNSLAEILGIGNK